MPPETTKLIVEVLAICSYISKLGPCNVPSLLISVATMYLTPNFSNSLINSKYGTLLIFNQPEVETKPSLTSTPTTIFSGP